MSSFDLKTGENGRLFVDRYAGRCSLTGVRLVLSLHRKRGGLYNDAPMTQVALEGLDEALQKPVGLELPLFFWSGDGLMINRRGVQIFAFSMAFAVSASKASAIEESEWRVYSEEANGDVHFFDPSRVSRTSNTRTVWKRIRYKRNVMAAASYESLIEIDCAEGTERILQRTFFSDKNWEEPAMNTDTKEKPQRPIVKGSATERLSKILCEE